VYVSVTIVENGLVTRSELFEVDDLDAAKRRFEELRPPSLLELRRTSPDPLRILPNAATRTADRHDAALVAGDFDALSRLCAPSMLFDDRRRAVLLTGGRDMFLASSRLTAGARVGRTLLATAGDRLALEHHRWSDPAGRKWEVENLLVHEVDADGRTVALIAFDPDDRRAAAMEMHDRFALSDEARCIPEAVFEGLRGVNAHDLERVRATMPADFVMDDHRRTGLGRLESAEAYLASLHALVEQSPDVTVETLRVIAAEPHGLLVLARNFGTLRDGDEFESVYVRMTLYQGHTVYRAEMFEPEDLDAARARFEELRGTSMIST
jgi:hypothetical protein